MLEACENRNTAERRIVSSIRQTSISQIVDGQAPSDGRTNVGRCQLPLPRFSICRPVEKRFRETYISLTNKWPCKSTMVLQQKHIPAYFFHNTWNFDTYNNIMIKGSKGIIEACIDDTFYNNTRISHRNLYLYQLRWLYIYSFSIQQYNYLLRNYLLWFLMHSLYLSISSIESSTDIWLVFRHKS